MQHIAKTVLDAEPDCRNFYAEIQHFNWISRENFFEDLERSLEELEKTCKPFLTGQIQVRTI